MRRALTATVLLLAPAPALACSCSAPETAAERREYARFIAARTEAIVEVEPVAGPDMVRQIGDTFRIVKVVAGDAQPGLIRLARSFGRDPRSGEAWMGGSSCDVIPSVRKQVLLTHSGYAPQDGGGVLPPYTTPDMACGQVLPIKDMSSDPAARGYVPVFSFGTSCQDWFLSEPGAIELIREEARKMGLPLGQRAGVSRSSRPRPDDRPSSSR